MKVCSVLFFISLFSLNLFAQTVTKNEEQLLNSGVLAMGNDSVESVPIIYQRDHVPFVKVIIDGKEYLFLFDTGATGCFISSEIVGKANIESTLPIEDAGGKENNANVVFKNICIGKSSFNNIVCLVANTERLANLGCVKIDGVLGTSLIKLCNWKLDPTNQMISF
ncbi:MAG: retropepsin-like aspartic protease [Candidatus Methylacidiphilales bacterium]